jgi:hypothetical protein
MVLRCFTKERDRYRRQIYRERRKYKMLEEEKRRELMKEIETRYKNLKFGIESLLMKEEEK